MIQERPIYFSEVAHLFHKKKRFVAMCAFLCFFLTLIAVVAVYRPAYRAEATFHQAHGEVEEMGGVESILLSIRSSGDKSPAQSVMRSKTLLGRVVEQLGLQVEEANTSRLKMMMTGHSHPQTLFGPVHYTGEKEIRFYLKKTEGDQFSILNEKKQVLGEGKMGLPFLVGGAQLTVRMLHLGNKPTLFRVVPKRAAVGALLKKLRTKKNRLDPNLLLLSCDHPQRRLAIDILNVLMDQYQFYLKEEHEQLANAQIAYLHKRQAQLGKEFDQALDSHVAYLKGTIGVDGFLGLSQEMEMLNEPKEHYTAKRHQLDLDAKKWKEERLEASVSYPWKEGSRRKNALEWQQANLVPNSASTKIFEGIDLETANRIYKEYSLEKDQLNTQIDQLEAVREMLNEPNFELGALGAHLTDPVSQKLIEKGTELSLKLADKESWSEKERIHLVQAFQRQKTFISDHLSKQSALLKTKREVIEDKMGLLQGAALELIKKEKGILDEKLKEIADKMGDIPEKWRLESQLKMKKELIMQVIEGLTQLSESKVVAHHLFHIESKPIDPADAPMQMKNPHLFLFASMGGILGAFFSFVGVCIQGIYRGLPISKAYLQDQGIPFLDMDHATFQKIALTLNPKETVALIGFACKDALAQTDCTFYECSKGPQSFEALSLIRKADRFILFLNEENVDTIKPYPREKLLCVLKG